MIDLGVIAVKSLWVFAREHVGVWSGDSDVICVVLMVVDGRRWGAGVGDGGCVMVAIVWWSWDGVGCGLGLGGGVMEVEVYRFEVATTVSMELTVVEWG